MLNNFFSIQINKPNLLKLSSVLLIIFGISTRFFGLPREFFYGLYFGTFIFIVTIIQVKNLILPRYLFITFISTCLLAFTGLTHFFFEKASDFSQQLLILLAISKVFCSIFILYLINKYSKRASWLTILNTVMRISILFGAFQWVASSLGFDNLINFLQEYKVEGIFPIFRINSIFPESQHFGTALTIYLFSNYQLSLDKLKKINSNSNDIKIQQEANKEKSSILFKIAFFLLIIGGSTTSYVVLIYLFLMSLLIRGIQIINFKPIKILKSIIKRFSSFLKISYKKLFIFLISLVSIIILFLTSGERIKSFSSKQLIRAQLLIRVVSLSDNVIDSSNNLTSSARATSYDRAIKYLKNPSLDLPPYRRDAQTIYPDGFMLNFIRFGFIGSLLFMFSFLVPLYFHTTKVGIIMFVLLAFLFWGKGATYPAPDSFLIYLYAYFVNRNFCKR